MASQAISKQELKKSKVMATLHLEAKGLVYEEWLHEQHLKVAEENQDVIEQALELLIKHNKDVDKKPYFNSKSNTEI
ncbi:hypothetical protein [Cytobacillus kochii]|uniref:hypothetical protein n=1 Tax=Cytobacillus kochii TaxID=859143 RepID=UPI00248186A4|nr:hypothetical protein [Cytobacillus kochii]